MTSSSHLEPDQVPNHLACRDSDIQPERREVQSAREEVGKAEEKHRRDPAPGILESEARFGHLVLLNHAAGQVVLAARWVDPGLKFARVVSKLSASENMEVVVDRVAAAVTLGSHCGSKDDDVLGKAWGCESSSVVCIGERLTYSHG
jgi:hypothetical protein